jgi:hypothetical protein
MNQDLWRNDMAVARIMASPLGRGGRIVLGVALIAWGIWGIGGPIGWLVGVAGLLPITLGVINGCILAPLLQVPFKGSDLPRERAG